MTIEMITPNFDWYTSVSSQKSVPPRCPYANLDKCPCYFQSLSLLGSNGFTTAIQNSEEKRLYKKWVKTKYWPKVNEQTPSIWGSDRKSFSNFCPEIAYDIFRLFASGLYAYADETDTQVTHEQLSEQHIPVTDWRWTWSNVTPLHYSECPLYSQLLSTNSLGADKNYTKEIIEIKPSACGFSVDVKELAKYLWKWVCQHLHR